jgi:hypothetical protein
VSFRTGTKSEMFLLSGRLRIGARRFRAKRKGGQPSRSEISELHKLTALPDYLNNLENSLRAREEECTALRKQVEAQRDEIDDLRHRLSLPLLPPPDTALGLVVPNSERHEGIPREDIAR